MKSIVLAAGIGKRMLPITNCMPKFMIQFNGKSLFDLYFNAFNECGINEAVLVVGHLAETIREKLGDQYMGVDVKYVSNRDYAVSGSAYSLWLARDEFSKEPFVLADSDILFHKHILTMLVNSPYENCLVVDPVFTDTGEEVKVVAEDGVVKQIGKKVVNHFKCVGEAVGLYKFSRRASNILRDGLEEYISIHGLTSEHEDALNSLLHLFEMRYVTTQGLPWIEMDFLEDLERARLEIYPKITRLKQTSREKP